MNFIAEEIREILALLGVKSISEIIGKTELFEKVEKLNDKQSKIIIEDIFNYEQDEFNYQSHIVNNQYIDKSILNQNIVNDVSSQIAFKDYIKLNYRIANTDRSVPTTLNGYLLSNYSREFLSEKEIEIKLKGYAGQSLASFLIEGISVYLEGIANDYVGKSLSGGTIVIKSPNNSKFPSRSSYAMGNTCLYGAIRGKLFANAKAGERFAVRNSGASAVVEGLGDHGCEYMTGGLVLILGEIGNNFGAGMTGGMAVIFDENGNSKKQINENFVERIAFKDLNSFDFEEMLKDLLKEHIHFTQSRKAKVILAEFEKIKNNFYIIKSYNSDLIELINHETSTRELSFKWK